MKHKKKEYFAAMCLAAAIMALSAERAEAQEARDLKITQAALTDTSNGVVTAEITNRGPGWAGHSTLRLIVWKKGKFEKEHLTTVFEKVPVLGPHKRVNVKIKAGVPIVGTRWSLYIDINNEVGEIDEENNRFEGGVHEMKLDETQVQKMPGKVTGNIVIKEAGGNNLGSFSCGNLVVGANRTDAKPPLNWKRKGKVTGDFSKRQCTFVVDDVPAEQTFVMAINAEFPKGCDQKVFQANSSFPMQLKKSNEVMKYDFTVAKIRCEIVK